MVRVQEPVLAAGQPHNVARVDGPPLGVRVVRRVEAGARRVLVGERVRLLHGVPLGVLEHLDLVEDVQVPVHLFPGGPVGEEVHVEFQEPRRRVRVDDGLGLVPEDHQYRLVPLPSS